MASVGRESPPCGRVITVLNLKKNMLASARETLERDEGNSDSHEGHLNHHCKEDSNTESSWEEVELETAIVTAHTTENDPGYRVLSWHHHKASYDGHKVPYPLTYTSEGVSKERTDKDVV